MTSNTVLSILSQRNRQLECPPALPPLLSLPLELRQKVYSYLLPYTNFNARSYSGGRTVWTPGTLTLLSVCKQLYDECAAVMYGENIFEVCVGYDSIEFVQLRRLKSGVMPSSTPPFMDFFNKWCVKRMRCIVVNVKYVDDYTGESTSGVQPMDNVGVDASIGMIKHNVRLTSALMYGISKQVEKLVNRLLYADELYSVQVNLRSWDDNVQTVRTVLEPLKKLVNVRNEIEVFGLPQANRSRSVGFLGPRDTDWRSRKCSFKPGVSSYVIECCDLEEKGNKIEDSG